MKTKTILFLFLFFLPMSILAEYNGHQIEFMITLNDGSEIRGYNYLADVYRKDKSIAYKEFLEKNYERVLNTQHYDSLAVWSYFHNRIKYNYIDYDESHWFIYTLTDKKDINKSDVKSLEIIELTPQSYAIGVSTQHDYEDRKWMAIAPVEKLSSGGTFCSHDIYIHKKTLETDSIIKELEKADSDFYKELKQLEEEMRSTNGEHYYKAVERMENLEEELDDKIYRILTKFEGHKVVIITMCTC